MQKIIKHLDDLVEIMNLAATEVHQKKGSELGTVKIVLLDLMKRIQSNLYGVKLLMNELPNDRYLILPVSLLVRTCLSDALTGFYLLTFSRHEESFKNELKVMALDYVAYAERLINLEPRYSGVELSEDAYQKIVVEKLHELSEKYPELILSVEKNKLKTRKCKDIRAGSAKEIFLREENISRRIGEKEKFDQLYNNPNSGVRNISYLYPLFRFYSQFQHYTILTRNLIDLPIKEHVPYFSLSLVLITQVLKSIVVTIELPEKISKALDSKIEEINIDAFL